MKRVVAGLLIIAATTLGLLSVPAFAQDSNEAYQVGKTYVLGEGEKHKGNLYVSSHVIEINGEVDGSLYCLSDATVVINGKIKGDIACLANEVHINGEVAQDARLAGRYIIVNGKVGNDASLAAFSKIDINSESIISSDLQAQSSDIEMNGEVGRDVYLKTNAFKAGSLLKVGGNIDYSSINEVDLGGGKVAGKITYHQVEHQQDVAMVIIMNALAFAVLAIVTVLIMPDRLHRSSVSTKKSFMLTVLAGVAVVFLVPIVAIVATLTIIGFPVAIVLAALYIVTLILSLVFFAYFLGSILLSGVTSIPLRMLGGVAFFSALCVIPYVDIFAIVIALIIGSGIVVRSVLDGRKPPRYTLNPPVEKPPMPTVLLAKSDKPEIEDKSKKEVKDKKQTNKTAKPKKSTKNKVKKDNKAD